MKPLLAVALILSLSVAWATEHCEVILATPSCPAGPGEVRPDWPLPKGCSCPAKTSNWSCWLSGREASAAQDLGMIDPEKGTHHWRILTKACEQLRASPDFVSDARDYIATVETSQAIEVTGGKIVLRGGFAGRPQVECTASAAAVTAAEAALEAAKLGPLSNKGEH